MPTSKQNLDKKKPNRRRRESKYSDNPKRNKPLSAEEIEQLFQAYAQNPIIQAVARTCRVSAMTVRKYRDLGKWDQRREAMLVKMRRASDNALVDMFAKSIKIVEFAIAKLVNQVKADKWRSKSALADLDKMIRLRAYLHGLPDSRLEVGKYEGLSDDLLIAKLRRVRELTDNEPGSDN